MKKTVQEVKRENVRQLYKNILSERSTSLNPAMIRVKEDANSTFTSVNLSYNVLTNGRESVVHSDSSQSRGFMDGIYKACYKTLSSEYSSLSNLQLYDYRVKPDFSRKTDAFGADAGVEVSVMVQVKDHGIAEFNNYSRSLIHSSFCATLDVFEFYINCQKAFDKLQTVLKDARKRSRADIEQQCVLNLCTLTAVNNYVK